MLHGLSLTENSRKAIKNFLPKGLLWRFILILLAPLVLVQIGLLYVFLERHTETVLRLLAQDIAGDVAAVVEIYEQNPKLAKNIASRHFRFHINSYGFKNKSSSWLSSFLDAAFKAHLTVPYRFAITQDHLNIAVYTIQGPLYLKTTLKRLFSRTTPLVFVVTTLLAFFAFIVAAFFVRNQIRPMRELARAARALGRGNADYFLKPSGAQEVRQAITAFNDMRSKLQRHLKERLEMLACLSHDLRTPLTRMKLQIACMPQSEDLSELKNDIEHMQHMLEIFLNYARSQAHEDLRPIDLFVFFNAFKKEFPSVEILGAEELTLYARPVLFRRCFVNLLSNAERFAKKRITLHIIQKSNMISFALDDDGPGIPEKERENIFRPFYRLDSARNLDHPGVGLGLSIVRDIVQLHGGVVTLHDSPLGGLRVIISFESDLDAMQNKNDQ